LVVSSVCDSLEFGSVEECFDWLSRSNMADRNSVVLFSVVSCCSFDKSWSLSAIRCFGLSFIDSAMLLLNRTFGDVTTLSTCGRYTHQPFWPSISSPYPTNIPRMPRSLAFDVPLAFLCFRIVQRISNGLSLFRSGTLLYRIS